jgi:integrase
MMAGITDKEVRALIAKAKASGKVATQADGMIPGLTMTASKTGIGSWVLRYRTGGKQKETTIGQFPAWGAADARERAKELRRAVDSGVDVAVEKQMSKVEAINQLTVDGLASAYFEKAEKDLHPHTFKQRKSVHARFVSPLIGGFPAASVTPAHVVEVVKKGLEGGKTLPRIVLLHVTQLYHHAVGNAVCSSNPCRDIRESAVVGKADAPKLRTALNAVELAAFLPALATIPRPYALAIRLMLLTGVRVGTLTESKVSEFDIDAGLWRVPHERRKNRRHTSGPFVVTLPPVAVEWVRELIQLADGAEYLLPVETRRHSDARNSMSKRTTLADWLDRMHANGAGGWRRITPHDTRSTCKSWLSELRVDYETRQRYLDHALTGMDAIYDKSEQLEYLRKAANTWLAFLDSCESGKEAAKIVKLTTAA